MKRSDGGTKPLVEQPYFRNDMKPQFFEKWKWYFEYRAALYKVQNPRLDVHYEYGAYEYTLPEDDYRQKLKNLERKRKAQLTEFTCKLENIRKNWNELFPLEDHPQYKKIQEKLQRLEREYKIILFKKKELENGYKPDSILSYSEIFL